MVHLVMVPILWLLSSKKMAKCPVMKGLSRKVEKIKICVLVIFQLKKSYKTYLNP